MGLLQKAVETYDCHQKYIGRYIGDHTVLAPISHSITRADLEITVNALGEFCSATAVDKNEPKIIIPVTEGSAGRSGTKICAHPLCDQLCYLAPYNTEKNTDYLEKLTKWVNSEDTHPKLMPILNYVNGGTILSDLVQCELIKLDTKGIPENEKLFVRWRVIGLDADEVEACWEDTSLFQAFIRYYRNIHSDDPQNLCMVTGQLTRNAQQHPKGIIPINGNAKLISANDESGFTYRGRFSEKWQAAGIGYKATQKAHNALRWLVAEQGTRVMFGGRTFLCWNPQGQKVCEVTGAFARAGRVTTNATDYRDQLKQTLEGYQSTLPKGADIVIAAFDAATSGRLALTYYNELKSSDFLQRLYNWDLHCCWPNRSYGIQSPGLWQIINCAFGTQLTEKGKETLKTDDRVMRQQMQRLVSCRIDCAAMPADIVKALLQRASNPLAYENNLRVVLLTTACAVIRKYRYDRYKEEWKMKLESNKEDRSYQFGRLLAVLEKVERDTYDKEDGREPHAIRQQSIFCQRPLYVAGNIEKQLERAYFPRLKTSSRMFYKRLIGQIMEHINMFPEEQWNQPLSETYLMGYYLQRNDLYTSKNQNDMEEEKNG